MSNTLIFIISVFWIWMLVDCYHYESNRLWLAIVLFCYFPGAFLYAIACIIRPRPYKTISPFRRLQLQQELRRAKVAARSIPKAHQYLILGNILLELGDLVGAESAYTKALTKEPKNTYALWGAALSSFYRSRFAVASRHLKLLLEIDPKHLQGDASLLYAKVLFNLEKWSVARSHLQADIYAWGHPESTVMLAKIEIKNGDTDLAKSLLQDLVSKLKKSPNYHIQRHQQQLREAKYLLKTLPLMMVRTDRYR